MTPDVEFSKNFCSVQKFHCFDRPEAWLQDPRLLKNLDLWRGIVSATVEGELVWSERSLLFECEIKRATLPDLAHHSQVGCGIVDFRGKAGTLQ